ncbi:MULTISPECIES: hypothetical protein [Halorussus]|uniref:hypothetical protein n=1 Tax=Halorussus TaxID=1070314 RepID=UPI00209CC52A|nr:hypothetical protein [Halorussus vallis]USZ76890.1 hypothetical protein NGM07_06060 [Halorussus vallis]
MDPREELAENCVAETKAYGYTLTIWGAGALLLTTYGTPTAVEIFAYVTGAVLGFAALAVAAFGQLFTNATPETDQHLIVASMVHVSSTLGNLLVAFLLIRAAAGAGVTAFVAFGVVGFQATITYNVLLLFEHAISRIILKFAPEERTDEQLG